VKRIHHYKTIRSTQTRARELADAGAPAWTIIRADRQTGGRGRMDRKFSSKTGGLYFTVLLRPRFKPTSLGQFSLKTGRLLTRALGELTGAKTKVKEPNDVLALCSDGRWRKVAGILIEASGGSNSLDWIIIGMGINLNNEMPLGLPHATSIGLILGKRVSNERVYRGLTRHLRKAWERL